MNSDQNTVYFINAFTTAQSLSGNPAAVCILDNWLSDQTLQAIAAQHNLSETAFAVREDASRYHIRWFTPTVEVDLCGHATLATAEVLFNGDLKEKHAVTFSSASGDLTVTRGEHLTLNFPQRLLPKTEPAQYAERLKIPIQDALSNNKAALLVCNSESEVREFTPNHAAIEALNEGVCYLTATGDDCDFVCRVFAPKKGIPEDPVTGSAYTSLAPYWAKQLGKNRMAAKQLSARGGDVEVTLQQDRVLISGKADIVIQGKWLQPYSSL